MFPEAASKVHNLGYRVGCAKARAAKNMRPRNCVAYPYTSRDSSCFFWASSSDFMRLLSSSCAK